MGTDIHYVVEFQDDQGAWHGLYASDLHWTEWWQSRFMVGLDKYRDDPHGLRAVRERNYGLFAFLCSVRDTNTLAAYGLGDEDGWAKRTSDADWETTSGNPYGWPDDVSPLGLQLLREGDYHSHGWMTLADVRGLCGPLAELLPQLDAESDAFYTTQSTQLFCSDLEKAMESLFGKDGTPALLTQPIGRIPDDAEFDNPGFDTTNGTSAHGFLAAVAYLRDHPTLAHHDPERIRILVGYDS
jgi:hypothetical protein